MAETAARRYTRLPIEVAAVEWTGANAAEMTAFLGALFDYDPEADGAECAAVLTSKHASWQYVYPGWRALLGPGGSVSVMDGDDFTAMFVAVDGG
jgi:hypothetical protein